MKTVIGLLTSFFAIFVPIQGLIVFLSFMIGLDTVFGIYTSVKLGGWCTFKSNKLFNLAVKSFFYIGAVLLAFLMDKFIFAGALFGIPFLISKAVCLFWTYIEIKSVDEKSVKLGNKSIWVIVREAIKRYKNIKKDLNEKEEH